MKTNKEARALFGKDYKDHVAEMDHVNPLKAIYEEHKHDAFTMKEDIKDAANSSENLQALSRKVNNAKRSRTQPELSKDLDYLKKKTSLTAKRLGKK